MRRLHPTRTTLLDFDGRVLPDERRSRVAAHLIGCVHCRTRLSRLNAIRSTAAHITSPAMPDAWAAIRARIDSGDTVILPLPEPADAKRPSRRRLAAGIGLVMLIVAGATAAAIALDPVRSWIRETIVRETPITVSGVEVAVPAASVDIHLVGAGPELRIRVQMADVELLQVTALDAAAAARFQLGESTVTVSNAIAGELHVVVPLRATVRLISDGTSLAEMRAGSAAIDQTLQELRSAR